MNELFKSLNETVDGLRKNVEYTDFTDKVKIAFPIALIASVLTLFGYSFINYFM